MQYRRISKLKRLKVFSYLTEGIGPPDLLGIVGDEESHGVGHDLNAARVDHDLAFLGYITVKVIVYNVLYTVIMKCIL